MLLGALGAVAIAGAMLPANGSPSDLIQASSVARNRSLEALRQLSKLPSFVAIYRLSSILDMPSLQYDFVWHGPGSQEFSPSFNAQYRPATSTLGINQVTIYYGFYLSSRQIATSVRVEFDPEACPSRQLIVQGLNVHEASYLAPGIDGGPGYPVEADTMKDAAGVDIQVNIGEGANCGVSFARLSKF